MKITFITLFISSFAITSEIKEASEKAIQNFYNDSIEIVSKKFEIQKNVKKEIQNKARQKFFRDQIYYWIIKKANKNIGYALLDNSLGKSMPITYLVIFDSNQRIMHSSIIKYREGYGGEIKSKKWLAQFTGMKPDSLYKFPKDLAGISGATISVRSVTKGFSKLSLLLPYIIKENNNEKQTQSAK